MYPSGGSGDSMFSKSREATATIYKSHDDT
jgi:hypothetical protein